MCGRYVVTNPVTKTKKLVRKAIQVSDLSKLSAEKVFERLTRSLSEN